MTRKSYFLHVHFYPTTSEWNIVQTQGPRKSTEYVINPEVFAAAGLQVKPTLKTIEPHPLRALLVENLRAYPDSSLADMHRRLGEELAAHLLRRQLLQLTRAGIVAASGANRDRRYSLVAKN